MGSKPRSAMASSPAAGAALLLPTTGHSLGWCAVTARLGRQGFILIPTDMRDIQIFMEMENSRLGEAELRFIDEVAALLEPWGMGASVGRFFAYLLLADAPTPIETIAADLEMSR